MSKEKRSKERKKKDLPAGEEMPPKNWLFATIRRSSPVEEVLRLHHWPAPMHWMHPSPGTSTVQGFAGSVEALPFRPPLAVAAHRAQGANS